jgi:hypothetical protein
MVRSGSTRNKRCGTPNPPRRAPVLQARMTDPNEPYMSAHPRADSRSRFALSVFAPARSKAPTPTRPCSRSSADCCHATCIVAFSGTKKENMQGFLVGGTGLEPMTPSLSIRGSRSRQCAQVRSHRFVERNFVVDRTAERTRTNTNPCHPCHARPSPRVCHRGGLRPLPRRTVRRPVDDDIRRSGRRSPPHPRTAVRSRAAAASSCSKAGSMSSIAAASRPFAAAI